MFYLQQISLCRMKKILIIQTAFIGDAVLATAIAEKIHTTHPEWIIDFMVRKGNEGLLSNHPYINEVIIWDKQGAKYINLFKLLLRIRKTQYSIVVNAQRFAATGILTAFSGARLTIGFDKNPLSFLFKKKIKHVVSTTKETIHEVERNQLLIESFTDKVYSLPKLYPSAKDDAKVAPLKSKSYITIAPSSVWKTKQFPKKKWIEFLNTLPKDLVVYVLGAPTEKNGCEKIMSRSLNPLVINMAGELTFLQSASLMKDAVMNYVNDSAPLHFATAMQAPVTAIYCSTIPEFGFGPLGPKGKVVQATEILTCKPCGLHGLKACPETHFKCAFLIQSEQLLANLPK